MFKNYVKTTLRRIIKQKGYSFIVLVSLIIGLTCFILISSFVRFEYSYDRFHTYSEDIYRILVDTGEFYRGKDQVAVTPAPLAQALKDDLPEVLNATRVSSTRGVIRHQNKFFAENDFYYIDQEFLQIFSFPMIQGDSKAALAAPYSVLITPRVAEKYFGKDDPVGNILRFEGLDYTVTGIIKQPPGNSYFDFDFLASFSSLAGIKGEERIARWNNWSYYTFVQLHKGVDLPVLEPQLTELLKNYYKEDASQALRLQPLPDLHFYTRANFELGSTADIRNVYLFTAIAFFILIIACFNFMNLSTARASSRAKEVGMRKVMGASRKNLIKQFLGEALFFSFFSFLISLVLVKMLMPLFATFINRQLEFALLGESLMLAGLGGLVIFVGLVAGVYPAFILSSFQPVLILKGDRSLLKGGSVYFRNGLVVMQFVISIALIFCSTVVFKQLHYLRSKDLGVDKDYVIAMRTYGEDVNAVSSELMQSPGVLQTATSSNLPVNITSATYGYTDGMAEDERLLVCRLECDCDFFKFFGIEFESGRGYSQEFSLDAKESIIINSAAAKALGWEDPIGKRFGFDHDKENRIVVGVVKDFHFAPLHLKIEPLVLLLSEEPAQWLSLRISSQDIPGTIAHIREKWERHFPEKQFDFTFLDDVLERMYRSERRLATIFSVFTVIAILVGCLGLFGLASYTAERKTKEIGIRKVLGASAPSIVVLLAQQFVKFVVIANLIAWPVAYFAMEKWLENFAYRTDLGVWTFILSGAIALLTALLTVSYQSLKASLANPISSLRYE